jgi:cell division protein FtsI/penicillin-binding protein 2
MRNHRFFCRRFRPRAARRVDGVRRHWIALAVLSSGIAPWGAAGGLGTAQRSLDTALHGTNAVAVVLDGADGRTIASEHADEAQQLARSPGSVLKPFFLAAALREGKVHAETTVVCRGNLRIAHRDLACTHPRSETVFDAERALAYSCNEWFASLALRFTPEQAAEALRAYGFGSRTGRAEEESPGVVREPRSDAELRLMVLGLDDVETTPAQLARGYFRLAQQLDEIPALKRGLEESVAYGMAHNAATGGLSIAGKTGTASDADEAWTHGWFAGIAGQRGDRIIVVIYVPRGNGADAALMAHRFFALRQRAASE